MDTHNIPIIPNTPRGLYYVHIMLTFQTKEVTTTTQMAVPKAPH